MHSSEPFDGTDDGAGTDDGVGTQDEPLMDVDDVSDEAKLNGIVAQTVSDLAGGHPRSHIEAVVRERSAQSGLGSTEADISAAVGEALSEGPIETSSDELPR